MELPFQPQQLDFLVEIANHRTSFWDSIFLFLNYLDTPYFAAFLIPFVWFGFSWKWGLKVSYLFLSSGILNSLLKYALLLPRPTVAMSEIGMFLFKSPGFPSGAAQTAFLFGALLMYKYRSYPAYALGIFYILLLSFSRLYLGIHYPLDLLGGWIAGCALFLIFIKVEKPIDVFFSKKKIYSPLWVLTGIAAVTCLLVLYPLSGSILALTVGAFVGVKYNLYPLSPKLFAYKLFKGSIAGILTLVFSFWALLNLPHILIPISIGLWVSLVMALFFSPWTRRN